MTNNTVQVKPVASASNATKIFNPANIKKSYTTQEWSLKEDFYINQISKLIFTVSPGPSEIKDMATKIDGLLSIARIDASYVKQAYERYYSLLKVEEKKAYNSIKLQLTQGGGKGPTINEIESAIATMIDSNPYGGTGESLYNIVRMSNERNIFMDGIVKDLEDKKDLLITHSGIIKIEYSLNSMQDNAPKV